MLRFLFAFLALILFGCAALPASSASDSQPQTPAGDTSMLNHASLPDLGPAPELKNTIWLNTDSPLRLADLHGKVVILEMWTFDCINCQHVIPSLKDWYGKYKDQGFVIIGNHFPEFPEERDLNNLKAAVKNYGIDYPIAQDNDGTTWWAYNNNYWPALYLIDKQGHIRYVHIGEGAYKETENNIKALLAETY